MERNRKEIPKEVYDRAMANHGIMTDEDQKKMFDVSIINGYGLYCVGVYKDEAAGKYMCTYYIGDSCD